MSANTSEGVQRESLYADKTNEQVIMIALYCLMKRTYEPELTAELYSRALTTPDRTTENTESRR